MWMLNGDMGEDNTTAGVFDKKDSTPGQWIESGPHLMLMPCLLYTSDAADE